VNWGVFLLLAGLFTVVLLLIQRTEAKRRRLSRFLVLLLALLTAYWANVRELGREFIFAVIAGLLLSFLFWLFIGRYNPVGDSDKTIQVLGLDD
jgi:uncharacterized membrane protein HdeD (DUF308 family)